MYRAHTVSTSVAASPRAVCEYVSDTSNLPVWAVDLPSGMFHNPMRVIPNGAGSAA